MATPTIEETAAIGYWDPLGLDGDADPHGVFVQITADHLDVGRLTNLAVDPRSGAISSFIGTTRNTFNGREVARLEYEAYTKMALKAMTKIGTNIAKNYEQVHKVVVAHRIGTVPVGESSVVILVSTEHRASGLAAAAWAIDELKRTVPIWKKEVYVDGTVGDGCETCHKMQEQWKSNPEFIAAHGSKCRPSCCKNDAPK